MLAIDLEVRGINDAGAGSPRNYLLSLSFADLEIVIEKSSWVDRQGFAVFFHVLNCEIREFNFLPLNPQDDLLHPTTRHGRRCKWLPAFFPESHSDRRLASLCMRVCDAFAQQEFRRRRTRGGARRVRNCLAAHSLDRNSPCCSAVDF